MKHVNWLAVLPIVFVVIAAGCTAITRDLHLAALIAALTAIALALLVIADKIDLITNKDTKDT